MALLDLERLLIEGLKQDFGIKFGPRIYGNEIIRQSAVDGEAMADFRRAEQHPSAPVGDIGRLREVLDAALPLSSEQIMAGIDYTPLFMRKSTPFDGVSVIYYVMEDGVELTEYDPTEVEQALSDGKFAEHIKIQSPRGEGSIDRQNRYGTMTYSASEGILDRTLQPFEGLESSAENAYNAVVAALRVIMG